MKTRLLFLAAACCLLNFWAGAAQPPELTGPVSGTVSDSQGAPLPGVQVTLRSVGPPGAPPVERTTQTTDDGAYTFERVPQGHYLLTVTVRGFAPVERRVEHQLRVHRNARTRLKSNVDVSVGGGSLVPPPTPVPTPRPPFTPTPTPRPPLTPTPTPRPSPLPTGTPGVSPTPSPVSSGPPQASPTPAGTPLTKIDEILSRMEWGNIAFNVPPAMSLERAETVVLLLSPKQAAEELEQRLREEGAAGDIKDARIKINDRMQAVLSGDGFQITPLTPDTLPVSRQEPTQWRWDVRALRGGTLKLNVVLNAVVNIDGDAADQPYPIRTFSQTYVVSVPWRGGAAAFLQANWPWLGLVLLSPGAVWLWARNRRKRRGAARHAFSAGKGAGIFISYRREDTAGYVGRLHDTLAAHFGAERVFMDIGSIGYGDDFVKAVEEAISASAVLIVVIGKRWLSVTDKQGRRRLDDPRDFVHREVARALGCGVKIIPALVQGAEMPGEDALPPPLAGLARRNAIEISDSRWQFDAQRLIEALEEELSREPAPPRPPAEDGGAG